MGSREEGRQTELNLHIERAHREPGKDDPEWSTLRHILENYLNFKIRKKELLCKQ